MTCADCAVCFSTVSKNSSNNKWTKKETGDKSRSLFLNHIFCIAFKILIQAIIY